MVNPKAAKTALLVGSGIFALLFIGTMWRFVSRLMSFAVLALFVVIAAYVAYELHAGWMKADSSADEETVEDTEMEFEGVPAADRDMADYSDSLTDDEIDRELDRLKEQSSDTDCDLESETEE